ncbi:MAG: alpha/beta fold hydrolase, partial [Polaromonas sp.]|nr:alpha/beta fold hydrolase [Polaromonas sp.]
VVLLIMGLGMQLIAWPPGLVRELINAGYRVIRFDNRDIGLSEKFDALGIPNLLWQGLKYKLGLSIKPPYSLHDMARDALGVLDALQIERAHIVGLSMGGMVAQRVALMAPQRALSLASIMSSSGARGLPTATPAITRQLLSRPQGKGKQAAIEHSVKLFKAIGSPGFPLDEGLLRERVTVSTDRNYNPPGIARQMVAIAADSTRAAELLKITTPTLVLHGKADPLVPFACGQDTANRIPGARLVGVDGMGHDLPPGVVEHILKHLVPHLQTADRTSQTA